MSAVVELITEWDKYERKHPGASIADFCSHYMMENGFLAQTEKQVANTTDQNIDHQISSQIAQLHAIHIVYAKTALKEIPEIELEWFYLMKTIAEQKEIRKSEVVSTLFMEPSTGIDILNRIKKAGLITERIDPSDKRAKLVKLSSKGEKILIVLHEKIYKADQELSQTIAYSNKKVLLQILEDVAFKQKALITELRTKKRKI